MSAQDTMSIEEAMEHLGRGKWAIMTAIKRKEIVAKKVLGRWYVSRASVESLLKMDEWAGYLG